MKITIRQQSLCVRVDEAELALLLAGERIGITCRHGRQALLCMDITLGGDTTLTTGASEGWHLQIHDEAILAYASGLPRRDALVVGLPDGPPLEFEVDVRDSARLRRRRGNAVQPAANQEADS